MANKKIDIIGIHPKTNKLILSDCGRTYVNSKSKYRKITWETEYDEVKSFRIVGITPYNPFETPIPTNYDDEVKLKVNKNEPRRDWEYSIEWKDKQGNPHMSDPIISIRPSTDPSFTDVLLFAVSAIITCVTLQFLFRRNKIKK